MSFFLLWSHGSVSNMRITSIEVFVFMIPIMRECLTYGEVPSISARDDPREREKRLFVHFSKSETCSKEDNIAVPLNFVVLVA